MNLLPMNHKTVKELECFPQTTTYISSDEKSQVLLRSKSQDDLAQHQAFTKETGDANSKSLGSSPTKNHSFRNSNSSPPAFISAWSKKLVIKPEPNVRGHGQGSIVRSVVHSDSIDERMKESQNAKTRPCNEQDEMGIKNSNADKHKDINDNIQRDPKMEHLLANDMAILGLAEIFKGEPFGSLMRLNERGRNENRQPHEHVEHHRRGNSQHSHKEAYSAAQFAYYHTQNRSLYQLRPSSESYLKELKPNTASLTQLNYLPPPKPPLLMQAYLMNCQPPWIGNISLANFPPISLPYLDDFYNGSKYPSPQIAIHGQPFQAYPYFSGPQLPPVRRPFSLETDGEGFLDLYEKNIYDFVNALKPTEEEKQSHVELFQALKAVVFEHFPSAAFERFGSTVNGFSLRNADLDFCIFMEYSSDSLTGLSPEEKKVECQVIIISELGEILKGIPRFINIKVLSRARIPIIKLTDTVTGINCDIGVNNELALYNTQLLKVYGGVDEKVREIAMIVKYWSKKRDLNEPYWGTLSSYCYLIMVIFYLQRTQPPILPVLQSITLTKPHEGDARERDTKLFTDLIIEGYKVFYFKDINKLKYHWKTYNNFKLYELLSGFFKYYAHDFPYTSSVLSIRTGQLLSKESKGWTTDNNSAKASYWFCIEDPFEISHNLARVVNRNSLYYIRGQFMRASKMISRYATMQALCSDQLFD